MSTSMRQLALALLLTACQGTPAPRTTEVVGPIGGDRPLATLHVPRAYRSGTPIPLLLVIHGYGSVGAGHVGYFALDTFADDHGMIVAAPDGLVDDTGRRFWNAVEACCDFQQRGVDDMAYLGS